MFKARDIFEKAGILLNDTGLLAERRWPLSELCGWLNDGLGAIVLQKPSATAKSATIQLVRGTLQELPEGYVSILRPVRNARTSASDNQPRRTISVVAEDQLSSINPAWHDEYSVRFMQQAKHFIFAEANPRAFYVYPGNDGTGAIDMMLCEDPQNVKPIAGADPKSLDAYDIEMQIDDVYSGVLLD